MCRQVQLSRSCVVLVKTVVRWLSPDLLRGSRRELVTCSRTRHAGGSRAAKPRPRRGPWCVVKDGVVAHEKLQSTPRRRVRLVNGAVIAYERAEPRAFGEVTGDVGARRPGILLDDRR